MVYNFDLRFDPIVERHELAVIELFLIRYSDIFSKNWLKLVLGLHSKNLDTLGTRIG